MDGSAEAAPGTVPRTVPGTVPEWVARRRFSVGEYHRMAETDVLGPDERVELIEGEIVAMSPIGGPHIGAVMAVHRLLYEAAGGRAFVSVQNSLRLGRWSEPEPDLVLLRPRADRYRGISPPTAEDALLVVEVADSSRRVDRAVKVPLYARHGIPEVWVVDLVDQVVDVHRGPGEAGYATMDRLGAGGVLEPLGLPGTRVAVADVLAG